MTHSSFGRTNARAGMPPAFDLSSTPVTGLIPVIGDNGMLYPMEKMEVHRRGLLHVAVSIFVFVGDQLLIQRRAIGKYHCGGLWANSCCTHPHWGEDVTEAAMRRTYEELGIILPLMSAGIITYRAPVTQGLIEHERVQVFQAKADSATLRLAPCPEEVMETRLISRESLCAEVRARPQTFTPWLKVYLERWNELGFDNASPVVPL